MKRIFTLALLLAFFATGCSLTDSDDDFIPYGSEDESEDDGSDDEGGNGSGNGKSSTKGKSSSSKKGSSSSGNSSSSAKSSSSSSFEPSDIYKVDPSTVIKGTITDDRDGKTYKIVTIGTQTWMAENLNYETESSVCADTTDSGCKKYGRRYYWSDVIDSENSGCTQNNHCEQPFKGLCPDGFRVPTYDDWITLLQKVSIGKDNDDKYLEAGYRLYSKEDGGSDVYGFSVYNEASYFWTSAHFNYENIYYYEGYRRVTLVSIGPMVAYTYASERATSRRSLRCVMDDRPVVDLNDPSTIKSRAANCTNVKWEPKLKPCNIGDTDNCEYGTYNGTRTVKIGKQVWMKYKEKAKPVYTTYTCPDGWIVPDSTQWMELINNVGGVCFAGKMLKSRSGWDKGNGMNAYGFNLEPTGYQSVALDYEKHSASLGREFLDERSGAPIYVRNGYKTTYKNAVSFTTSDAISFKEQKNYTANIFCLKGEMAPDIMDSIFNPSIEYGEFTDPRDGQTYKTTVIGEQKWMAQNLNYKTDSSITNHDILYSDYSSNFGRLYTFEEANEVCPAGWHLPQKEEFDTLVSVTSPNHDTKELVSKYYRKNDTYGFSIGFGGYAEDRRNEYDYIYYSDIYHKEAEQPRGSADFWSSDVKSDSVGYILFAYVGVGSDTLNVGTTRTNRYFHSVRCINDTLFKKDIPEETEEESEE